MNDQPHPSLDHPANSSVSQTSEAVRQTSRDLSNAIFADWQELNTILQTHEELVRRRWQKKTRDQRETVLLKAWGTDLSKCHRPDLELHFQGPCLQVPHPLDAWKWPYINLEDLLKPRILPLFLDTRGRNLPHIFCHADLGACDLGLATGKIDRVLLDDHTLMFNSGNTADKHTGLLPSSQCPQHSLSKASFSSGDGLLVLEIQQRIWKFLRSCAREIIHDIPDELLQNASTESNQQSFAEEPSVDSLVAMTLEAPYRPPPQPSLTRINALVAAKRSAAADHIWMLRENPTYFADCIAEWKEHQPEMLLDIHGKKHAIHKAGLTPAFWNRVFKKLITESYLSLAAWDAISQQSSNLQTSLKQHSNMADDQELPEKTLITFNKLVSLLRLWTDDTIALLKSHVPPSPPMRDLWHRESMTSDPHSTKFRVAPNPRTDTDEDIDRTFHIYQTLWDQNERQQFPVSLITLVDELGRMTDGDTKARGLQSSLVMGTIGDLGVASEVLRQLSLYRASAQTTENGASNQESNIGFNQHTTEWDEFKKMSWQGVDLAGLGSPTDGRFSYPVNNRRTRSNVGALRKAEQNLDAFWFAVDKHFAAQSTHSHHPHLPDEVMKILLAGNRSLQRTPEWEEPVKSNGISAPQQRVDHDYNPLAGTYLQLRPKVPRSLHLPGASNLKTRGATVTVNGSEATKAGAIRTEQPHIQQKSAQKPPQAPSIQKPPRAPPTKSEHQAVYTVDKRAKKVFNTLFFTQYSSDAPGDTTWPDFVHALQSTGLVPEKLYGSVWQFSPAEPDPDRGIQFHEPRPVPKIAFHMARRIGRRLTRAYGWHGHSFVLRS